MWFVYSTQCHFLLFMYFFCAIICFSAPSTNCQEGKPTSCHHTASFQTLSLFLSLASAYANIQWEQPHQPRTPDRDPFGYPHHDQIPPLASYAPQPDYMTGDDDLIRPKKLVNPVKASKSHQELHRELLMNHKR